MKKDGEQIFEDLNAFTYPLEPVHKDVPAGYTVRYYVEATDEKGVHCRADYFTLKVGADGSCEEQKGAIIDESPVMALYNPDGIFLVTEHLPRPFFRLRALFSCALLLRADSAKVYLRHMSDSYGGRKVSSLPSGR